MVHIREISSLDEVDPVSNVELQPSSPLSSPNELFFQNTLARSERIEPTNFRPSKPVLEMQLIDTLEQLHRASGASIDLVLLSLDEYEKEISRLNAENVQKLEEAAKRNQETGFWAFLRKIAACILGVISIIFGISLASTGAAGIVGAVMITAGVLSIANLVLSETGAWNWVAKAIAQDNEDLRRKLAFYMPLVFGIITGAIGLAGGICSAVWAVSNLADKALLIAQVSATIAEGVTEIGSGVAHYRQSLSSMDLSQARMELFIAEHGLQRAVQHMEKVIKALNQGAKAARESIQLSLQTNKRILSYQG